MAHVWTQLFATHHARREEILAKRGEIRLNGDRSLANSAKLSYAHQASDTLGIAARTVRQDLHRGKNIAPEIMAEVSGTDLDKGVVLDQLAATPRDQQAAKTKAPHEFSGPVGCPLE